jgi:hypothetical protein
MPRHLTHLDAIRANAILQQRLAKYLVLQCVRNSHLENLHAGIAPSSAAGDYADVTVQPIRLDSVAACLPLQR